MFFLKPLSVLVAAKSYPVFFQLPFRFEKDMFSMVTGVLEGLGAPPSGFSGG